jgi:hypothetical protein
VVETRANKYTFLLERGINQQSPPHSPEPQSKETINEESSGGAPLVPEEKARLETCMGYVPIHHMARMSSGTGMARVVRSRNQPCRHMPMLISRAREPGSPAHRVRKAVVLRGSPALGCGDSRSADSRSALVHFSGTEDRAWTVYVSRFHHRLSDFVSRGLRSQTVLPCSVYLDSLELHGRPCRRSTTALACMTKAGIAMLPMGRDGFVGVEGSWWGKGM